MPGSGPGNRADSSRPTRLNEGGCLVYRSQIPHLHARLLWKFTVEMPGTYGSARQVSSGNTLKTATEPRRHRSYLGLFLGQMLRRPGRVAAVLPSSTALARMMTRDIGPETGSVVELGGGTGKITDAILARGVPPDRLAVFETNRAFANLLRRRFPVSHILDLNATRVDEAPLEDVGAVVSGLPMLAIPTPVQLQIVGGAFRMLRPGGVFVQFTYGWRPPVDRKVREALGLEWTVSPWVRRNMPPARVYTFKQTSAKQAGLAADI